MADAVLSDVMTADEVAVLLRLNRKTVYDGAKTGDIPCARIGRAYRFSRSTLLEWLRGKAASCARRKS
jgi:excisionase family DNA binding protein